MLILERSYDDFMIIFWFFENRAPGLLHASSGSWV